MACSWGRRGLLLSCTVWVVLICAMAGLRDCLAYQNFTVGDELGWEDPASNPKLNYTFWTIGKNFTLGDYLLFKYPSKNHSVVMTQNETMYLACNYEDGNDDYLTYGGEPGSGDYAEVPLVKTGPTYFFCGAYDGEPCRSGMKFSINVGVGDGLPPSLAIPPPAPEGDDSSPSDSTDTTPLQSTYETAQSPSAAVGLLPMPRLISLRIGVLLILSLSLLVY